MNDKNIKILQRALNRERLARKQAEKILENKSAQLYETNKQLESSHKKLITLYDKTNSQLQGVFENIVDAYVIIDIVGNILKMNDSAVELLDFNSVNDDINLMSLVDKDQIKYTTNAFKKLIKQGSITDFRVKILTKKKKNKLVHINASVIYENGKVIGAQGIVRDITIEANYQKQIEAERQKYMNIIDNMNLGLLEVDNNDEIQFVNQRFTEISGYTRNELIGKVGKEIFPINNEKNKILLETKKRQNGESNSYEIEVKTKSGNKRTWLISGAPNYDMRNNVVGSIGIHLDITNAKQNSKLIEEQKKELDVIVNNSSSGIVLLTQDKIIRTNAKFQHMLGYSQKELYQLNLKDICFQEDYMEFLKFIKKMNSGELNNFTINKRYQNKDGSIIWAKTNVNAVRDSSGQMRNQVAIVEDITVDREKNLMIDMINNITKSILGKTDIYEIAWEISNIMAEYLDTEDCVIYLVDHKNKVLEQVAAYGGKIDKKRNIINKLIIPIGKGIVGDVVRTGISEIIKDTNLDHRYIKDDKFRNSEITVPIIINGKVIAVVDSEHIDKNHYTKQHLKALESVASLVAIKLRTAINIRDRKKAEAINKDLLLELEKNNRELQEYAHIVSHDLKSPLRSINALINWIKEDNSGKFDHKSIENFNLLEKTLEKMEHLISDILEYSSIAPESLSMQQVDLNLIVEDLKKILYTPNHISINILNKLPIIEGDKTKFQQLFQNLISNAVKFNDKETGIIEIDVIDKKSFYQFSVKDNGVGIEKKYHKKIFKIFHFLSNTKDSTGIGLSIVKKIVDLHKGEIWIESKIGEGTIFHFTIKKIWNHQI